MNHIDTVRVISEVRLRPPLWDLSCALNKDRDTKIKAWLEVCRAIAQNYDNVSDNEKKVIERNVQQRWKTARDAYVRCKAIMKNAKSRSGGGNKKKYAYYDCMRFLDKKHLMHTDNSFVESQDTLNEPLINIEPAMTDDDVLNSILPSTSDGSNSYQTIQTDVVERSISQTRRKRIREEQNDFEREMLNTFKENTKLMQNDDMSFFCSLLPVMKTFTNHQKLLFRSEVLKKAIEISDGNITIEDRQGTTYYSTSESQLSDTATSYITE